MKRLTLLLAIASLSLAACGAKTTVGPAEFDTSEQAILYAVDKNDDDFLSYQIEKDKKLVFAAYVTNSTYTYLSTNLLDVSSSPNTLYIGATAEDGRLIFEFNRTKIQDIENVISFTEQTIDETITLSKKPILIKQIFIATKENVEFDHIPNVLGEHYTPLQPTDLQKGQTVIDVIAYLK